MILLFVSRCFNIMNYVPAFSQKLENSAVLLGNLLALFIQLLLLLPALALYRRFDGQNVVTVAYNRAKPLGWAVAFLYFAVTLAQLAGTLVGFEYFMTDAVYPNASVVFIIVTMSLACFLCGRHGLEGITRASAIVFVFLLLSAGFICAVSLRSIDPCNFHPMLGDPVPSVLRAAFESIGKASELFLLILLYPKVKGSQGKCSLGFVAASFLMLEVTALIVQGVLGEYADTQTFPYYTLASVSDTRLLQRLDSLHMMNWVFSAFIRCTLLVIIGNYCVQMILPQRTHKFILPAMFLLTTGAAVAVGYSTEILGGLNATSAYGAGVLLLTAGLPLLLLLLTKRKRKER